MSDGEEKSLSSKTHATIVAVVVALIGATAVVAVPVIENNLSKSSNKSAEIPLATAKAKGKIITPSSGDFVSNEFLVRVEHSNVPKDAYLWLASSSRDYHWPHRPSIQVGSPTAQVQWKEGSSKPGTNFQLSFLLVSEQGNEIIEDWMKEEKWDGIHTNKLSPVFLDKIELVIAK